MQERFTELETAKATLQSEFTAVKNSNDEESSTALAEVTEKLTELNNALTTKITELTEANSTLQKFNDDLSQKISELTS